MSRPYRLQASGLLYHITSRGDDRKKIFLNETDYRKFLEYLKAAKEKFNFFLYAYCLMDNHYHLLLETTQPNISCIMQSLNTAEQIGLQFAITYSAVSKIAQEAGRLMVKNEEMRKDVENIISQFKA